MDKPKFLYKYQALVNRNCVKYKEDIKEYEKLLDECKSVKEWNFDIRKGFYEVLIDQEMTDDFLNAQSLKVANELFSKLLNQKFIRKSNVIIIHHRTDGLILPFNKTVNFVTKMNIGDNIDVQFGFIDMKLILDNSKISIEKRKVEQRLYELFNLYPNITSIILASYLLNEKKFKNWDGFMLFFHDKYELNLTTNKIRLRKKPHPVTSYQNTDDYEIDFENNEPF